MLIVLTGGQNWHFSAPPGIAHSAGRVTRREAPGLLPVRVPAGT